MNHVLQRRARRSSALPTLGCLILLTLGTNLSRPRAAAESTTFPAPYNSQAESIPFERAEQALAGMLLPPGFHATLFAAEPDVQQPIGMTTDAKGRLWVAENYTYAEQAINFDPNLRDRIVIFEDRDHDGRFDQRAVFWDRAEKLTSVAVGFGGVFALCPPNLLFLPDRDGDDVPDGEPEILLDGWDEGHVRHNIANGLKWGPDGWLYGRHGILADSYVGKPGTPREQRTRFNCAIWRYHPITRAFEVVAEGTTNPWGHDWDDYGQLFFINTVIGHLWHVVPGAYYKRMYGDHFNPHLYALIDQTADHFHWDTREVWSDIRKLGVTPTTSDAGGGHAHSGFMIYLGDNWPKTYRNTAFTINYHGKRLNNDRLERQGAGYVGRHAPDFLQMQDPWFRGIDLLYGPDGGVYISDWSDIGECHDHDAIHRTSGRIYKVTYATPPAAEPLDLSRLDNAALVRLQTHPNDWFVRQSRQILQERTARGDDMKSAQALLRKMFDEAADARHQLRALWGLHVTRGDGESWLWKQLHHPNEHVRVWAIRLLIDQEAPSPDLAAEFARMASTDSSGLVLSFLASALQKTPAPHDWPLAEGLVARKEFAADRALPLMIWYGIEAQVPKAPQRAVALAAQSQLPQLRQFIARRLTEDLATNPTAVESLVQLLVARADTDWPVELLRGMSEAMRGWARATPPPSWTKLAPLLARHDHREVRQLTRELSVLFGDPQALVELQKLVANGQPGLEERRHALKILTQRRTDGLFALLSDLLEDRDLGADAIQALAALGDPTTPTVLLQAYPNIPSETARAEVINTLVSRPTFAAALLEAVSKGVVNRQNVGAFQLRQMEGFPDPALQRRILELWPERRRLSVEKQAVVDQYRAQLTPAKLSQGDPTEGRRIFQLACAACHTLFGEGGPIGPDLTGSDRRNLDYLLMNIVDPSGLVADSFRVSTLTLKDGRVISGIAGNQTARTLTVQTPTESLILEHTQIESILPSQSSLMPDGLLEGLTADQVRDLIVYLQSPQPR